MAAGKNSKVIYASQAQLYEMAVQKMNADEVIVQHSYKAENYSIAAAMFDEVGDYLDAKELAERCRQLEKETRADEKETAYERCVDRMKDPGVFTDVDKLRKLVGQLEALDGYRDSGEMLKSSRDILRKMELRGKIKVNSILGCLAAIVILIVVGLHTGYIKYYAGVMIQKYGKYEQAEKIFRSMPGFKDADEYVRQADLRKLKKAKIKETVNYGGLKWKVMDKDEDTLTLIAIEINEGHIFYNVPFSEEPGNTTWEDSSIRKWLNEEVYETQFTEEERSHMLLQTSEDSENPEYGTVYEGTEDYLTILSVEEAETYQDILKTLSLEFWVRTPGDGMDRTVCYSGEYHDLRMSGIPSDTVTVTARPVIRLDRSSL